MAHTLSQKSVSPVPLLRRERQQIQNIVAQVIGDGQVLIYLLYSNVRKFENTPECKTALPIKHDLIALVLIASPFSPPVRLNVLEWRATKILSSFQIDYHDLVVLHII